MKVILGIGNPGDEYKGTRHNIGFEILDRFKLSMKLGKGNYLYARGKKDNSEYLLVKPLVYVNESGIVAKDVVSEFGIELPNFLVILDDFDLPLGATRMRSKGSSGGHRGLESIIYQFESEDFSRLRIGIGSHSGDAVDFVLSRFTKNELTILESAIEKSILSIETFIKEGIDRAMEVSNT